MALDKRRFIRVPRDLRRRYTDYQTGEIVSYRQAIKRSEGVTPEQKSKIRQRTLGPKRDTPSAMGTVRRGYLERLWRDKKGTPARGPNADPEFLQMIAELNQVGKLGYKGKNGWINVLDKYKMLENVENLSDFFIT
jgi:hypothetical protein